MLSGSAPRALVETDLDRALLLARQGVALDDTVQTRGNLLAALLKSPAAIGVIRPTGEGSLRSRSAPTTARSPSATTGNSSSSTPQRTARRHHQAREQLLVDRESRVQPGRQPPRDRP